MKEPHATPKPTISATRRERERTEMRRRIIDVAREMFVTSGYDAVTLRAVADAVEYSPAAIYKYFADKNALILAICLDDYAELTAAVKRHEQIDDPVEKLRALCEAYIEWGVAHPRQYQMLMMTPLPVAASKNLANAMDNALRDPTQDAFELIFGCVQAAIDARQFKPKHTDAELIAVTFVSALHGVVSIDITFGSAELKEEWGVAELPLARRADSMLDALLDSYRR